MEPGQKFCFHNDDFAGDVERTAFDMTIETDIGLLKRMVFRTAIANACCWEAVGNTPQASLQDAARMSVVRAAFILSVVQKILPEHALAADAADFGTIGPNQRLLGPAVATRIDGNSFTLHLGAFMEIADCSIRQAQFQDPAAAAGAVLDRPTLAAGMVTVPQAMKPMFGTAVSGMSVNLRTSNQLLILSLLALYKTGHHWTPETIEILRRLCGAIGLPQEYADNVFWCRVVIHPANINARIAYMAGLHAATPLRQEIVTRCGGTGHGIAKLNLMWAIIMWARARGERQYEVYLFEIFHKCNRGAEFRTIMHNFRNTVGAFESAGLAGVPNFNRCALNSFGFSSLDGVTIVQNDVAATRAWYTARRGETEAIDDLKAPILELVAVVGDRIAQSLCFGSAAGISGATKDAVRVRLAAIKTAMDAAVGPARVAYGGRILDAAQITAPIADLANLLAVV